MDLDGENANDNSGFSVSLSASGNRVAIGEYGFNSEAGRVRIFDYDNGSQTWSLVGDQTALIGAFVGGVGDRFGSSVSISADGSRVAIGAPDNGNGYVKVFDLVGGVWSIVDVTISGTDVGDKAGLSVSLSDDGSRVAVGAPSHDSNKGQVRVFALESGSWTLVDAAIESVNSGDRLGCSVSLNADGSKIAMGARGFDVGADLNTGQVRVYELIPNDPNTGVWTIVDAFIEGVNAGDLAGFSVSLNDSGSKVAIGEIGFGVGGRVRVLDSSSGTWTLDGASIDGAAGDDFGSSVALSSSGSKLIIGSITTDSARGTARIYKFNGASWEQIAQNLDGNTAGDEYGAAVSISADGCRVAIGGFLNDSAGEDSGHTRVYQQCVGPVASDCTFKSIADSYANYLSKISNDPTADSIDNVLTVVSAFCELLKQKAIIKRRVARPDLVVGECTF